MLLAKCAFKYFLKQGSFEKGSFSSRYPFYHLSVHLSNYLFDHLSSHFLADHILKNHLSKY